MPTRDRSNNLTILTDMNQGTIGSMKELGITESYKLKRQVVLSASEAAEMILRYIFRAIAYVQI